MINNATMTKATPVLEISAADFDWITRVNQRGTFRACQIIGKYMAEQGYGRIINMASLAGQNGGRLQAHIMQQVRGNRDAD